MKIKRSILSLAFYLSFIISGFGQTSVDLDLSKCQALNSILLEAKKYFQTSFSLLDQTVPDIVFLKQNYKTEFLSLAKDSVTYNQISDFINFNGRRKKILTNTCVKGFAMVPMEKFDSATEKIGYNKKTRKKTRISYPIVGITAPYFFSKNNLCLIGIDYYSGATSGSFGYYLFGNEDGIWKFNKQVLEMLK